jgi:predicted NAD/FAD-binding protein
MTTRRRIVIIGSGITGLSAAWLLAKSHDVTLIERDRRCGGHADTVDVATPEGRIPIDTGFIVYNVASYPNFVALLDHLGVETTETDMSFAVSLDGGSYEYNGNGLAGLFAQRSNILRPAHYLMIRDILRFFRAAASLNADASLSLADWLAQNRFSAAFVNGHILPMAAAIWSAPVRELKAYPAVAFARVFANHGLLQATGRPRWRTVTGGSRRYVAKLVDALSGSIVLANGAVSIARTPAGVNVTLADHTKGTFDDVVLACHADEALALMTDADPDERRILGAFRFMPNTAVLHTDTSLLPRRRRAWAAWNYMDLGGGDRLCVSYWMNALQPLATRTDYIVTLNPPRAIDPRHVVRTVDYAHPIFDAAALAAQGDLWRIQGRRSVWFAGAWCGSGFHEDGLQAGLHVAERLGGVRRPWTVANPSGRIVTGPAVSTRLHETAA